MKRRRTGLARSEVQMQQESKKVAYAALAANCLIALMKFAAGMWTGSSAMLSEGIHSLVDSTNQVLLLYGIHRASRPADAAHPWGHGRELYFWSFIVALLIFALGAGLSFYEGIGRLRHPAPIERPLVNYAVLGAAACFEAFSGFVAFRTFNDSRGNLPFWRAVIRSKDPTSFIILFEDSAALAGIAIAAAGIFLAQQFDMPVFDPIASLAIAALLGATAAFLAREAKSLLLGEPALPAVGESVRHIAALQPGIEQVIDLSTVQLGPEQVVVALTLDLADDVRAADIERTVAAMEREIKQGHPEVVAVFVKPKTAGDRPLS